MDRDCCDHASLLLPRWYGGRPRRSWTLTSPELEARAKLMAPWPRISGEASARAVMGGSFFFFFLKDVSHVREWSTGHVSTAGGGGSGIPIPRGTLSTSLSGKS